MLDVRVRIVISALCIWACLSVTWRVFISKICTMKVIDSEYTIYVVLVPGCMIKS